MWRRRTSSSCSRSTRRGNEASTGTGRIQKIQYLTVGVPDPTARHGRHAVESFRGWLSTDIDWKATAHRYLELDRERVLVPYRRGPRDSAGGREAGRREMEGATLFHLRERRVTRIIQYFDRS